MQPFDSEFIREQRELAEKATPRPWETEWNWDCDYVEPYTYAMWAETPTQRDHNFDVLSVLVQADQAYMTAACNTYPLALAEIERLQAEVERLKAEQESAESALISMVQQYCTNKINVTNVYSHDFMSAGEEAFTYLVNRGLAEWLNDNHAYITFPLPAAPRSEISEELETQLSLLASAMNHEQASIHEDHIRRMFVLKEAVIVQAVEDINRLRASLAAAQAENGRLTEALDRFAKINLDGPIGNEIAWDILNARAVLAGDK